MAPSRIATSVFTARPGEDGIWTVNMVVSVLPTLSASSRFRNPFQRLRRLYRQIRIAIITGQ